MPLEVVELDTGQLSISTDAQEGTRTFAAQDEGDADTARAPVTAAAALAHANTPVIGQVFPGTLIPLTQVRTSFVSLHKLLIECTYRLSDTSSPGGSRHKRYSSSMLTETTFEDVNGVRIAAGAPKLRPQQSFWLPATVNNPSFSNYLALQNTLNANSWTGFAAKSVMFLGFDGDEIGTDLWELTFGFLFDPHLHQHRAPNAAGVIIASDIYPTSNFNNFPVP